MLTTLRRPELVRLCLRKCVSRSWPIQCWCGAPRAALGPGDPHPGHEYPQLTCVGHGLCASQALCETPFPGRGHGSKLLAPSCTVPRIQSQDPNPTNTVSLGACELTTAVQGSNRAGGGGGVASTPVCRLPVARASGEERDGNTETGEVGGAGAGTAPWPGWEPRAPMFTPLGEREELAWGREDSRKSL